MFCQRISRQGEDHGQGSSRVWDLDNDKAKNVTFKEMEFGPLWKS